MFSFLKKKKKYKNYYDCLSVISWSEYQSLDKFQKIIAFTLEGVDDVSLLSEVFHDQISRLSTGTPMPKEIEKRLKSNLPTSTNFANWIYRYRHIAKNIERYWQQESLQLSDYRYFSFSESNTEEERKLYGVVMHKNDPYFKKYYPPNFFYDNTKVSAYTKRQLDRRFSDQKKITDVDIEQEFDFDFNIPEYIYKTFGVKN